MGQSATLSLKFSGQLEWGNISMKCSVQSELKRETLSELADKALVNERRKQTHWNLKVAICDKRKDCMRDLCICLQDYLTHIIKFQLSMAYKKEA